MPALSYDKKLIEVYNFKDKIINNIKKHIIRRYGPGLTKRPFRVGDTLYHYEHWRTSRRNNFHTNTCLWVADVNIIDKGFRVIHIEIEGKYIYWFDLEMLARNDGFDNFHQFKGFFIITGLPFYGQIIGWTNDVNYGGVNV